MMILYALNGSLAFFTKSRFFGSFKFLTQIVLCARFTSAHSSLVISDSRRAE